MPIPCPHFKITIVKRSQEQSAVAGAAYQSGERLFSEYDQKTKFYNKKKELVHAEIMLPSHSCLLEQRGRPAVTCRGGGSSILLTQDRSVAQKPHWGFCCCANASLPWQAEQAHHAPSKEKQSVPDCWVSVKQFSKNDTATACQDWLRSTRLGRGSIKSHVRTVKVLGMGLFAFQERIHLWKGVTH